MSEILLIKNGGMLFAADDDSKARVSAMAPGTCLRAKIMKSRNLRFHRKFFGLLDAAFEYWEPIEEYKGVPVLKDREKFRKDVTILAGFRHAVAGLNGVRWEADSIAFHNMDEEQFERVYSAVLDVILRHVIPDDPVIQQHILEFA